MELERVEMGSTKSSEAYANIFQIKDAYQGTSLSTPTAYQFRQISNYSATCNNLLSATAQHVHGICVSISTQRK